MDDITRNLSQAYLQVLGLGKKEEAVTEDQVIAEEELDEAKMDPVDKKALKKDFKDREDKDIDNDGDEDESDEYLHNRRKAISKAVKEETSLEEFTDEELDDFMVSEEFEQLDEISQGLLRRYHGAAASDLQKRRQKLNKGTMTTQDHKAGQNRVKGLNRAANKMEEVEIDEAFPYDVDHMPGKLGSRPTSGMHGDIDRNYVKTFHHNKEKEARAFAKSKGYKVKKHVYPAGHTNAYPHEWQVVKEDNLANRTGINAVNRKPRAGQTDTRDIPAGNKPNSQNKFTDRDKDLQKAQLKKDLKAKAGTHKKPSLPEKRVREEFDQFTDEEIIEFMLSDEFKQLDEISQGLLRRYHGAAASDLQKRREKLNKGTMTTQDHKAGQRRVAGLNRAANKMEATENEMKYGRNAGMLIDRVQEAKDPKAGATAPQTYGDNASQNTKDFVDMHKTEISHDAEKANLQNFKDFTAKVKVAKKRPNDNSAGDTKIVK